jgi:ribosomal protein S7
MVFAYIHQSLHVTIIKEPSQNNTSLSIVVKMKKRSTKAMEWLLTEANKVSDPPRLHESLIQKLTVAQDTSH